MKISSKSIKILKEKFIIEYCKKNGWNKNNLSPSQLIEIITQDEYKNPNVYKLYFK